MKNKKEPKVWTILKEPVKRPPPDLSDLQITVEKINTLSHPRKLNARWTIEKPTWDEIEAIKHDPDEPEIWTILKTPPKPKWDIEDELSDALAKEITAAIDKEILDALISEATSSKTKRK